MKYWIIASVADYPVAIVGCSKFAGLRQARDAVILLDSVRGFYAFAYFVTAWLLSSVAISAFYGLADSQRLSYYSIIAVVSSCCQ